MFFGRLFYIAHEAFERMLDSVFKDRDYFSDGEYAIPLVHSEADYLSPLRRGQDLLIRIFPVEVGKTSFRVKYSFLCGDLLFARAETVHVLIFRPTGKAVSLPDDFRKTLLSL